MMIFRLLFICMLLLTARSMHAQNYNALHGSNYSGALGVYNNPSTILNSPYKWDVTVLGLQYQTISNVIKGPNFPFNLMPSATYYMAEGNTKRYADITADLHLLNGRIALDENTAIAFGLNLRDNTQARTTPVNYTDSIKGPRSFLYLNLQNRIIDVDMAHSAWMELYGSYAKTIWNNEVSRFNVGGTLKILRGMSGAFARVREVGIRSDQFNDQTIYRIENGNLRYGYSANHGDGESFNASDFFAQAKNGLAIDLGAEYLIKSQAVASIYDDDVETDYDWKVGFALLDVGWNNYKYSSQSRIAGSLRNEATSLALQEKFKNVTGVSTFNDSVATLVNMFEPLTGNFKVANPMRAVVNIDHYVSGNIFVNGELSANLTSWGKKNYAVRESKFITITPRWETRKLGFFMPIQFNRHGNFWVGGAVKAGPLLLGTHNLLNAFSKNKYLGSGAYLALTIRPFDVNRNARSRYYECPVL